MLTYRSTWGRICNRITFVGAPVLVVAGIALLINGTLLGLIPLLFAPVWAWHALWYTACELTVERGSDTLHWRSALRSGAIPVSNIARIHNAVLDLNIALIELRQGRHLAVYRYGDFDEFVRNAGLGSARGPA